MVPFFFFCGYYYYVTEDKCDLVDTTTPDIILFNLYYIYSQIVKTVK